MPREQVVTTTQLSSFFGVTTRQVQRLTEQKILERSRDETGQEKVGRYPLRASVRAYIAYLRETPGLTAEDQLYTVSRANRMQALAEEAQLKTALLRGELCRRDHMEFLFGRLSINFRSRLLALPSSVGRRLAKIDAIPLLDITPDRVRAWKRAYVNDVCTNFEFSRQAAFLPNQSPRSGSICHGFPLLHPRAPMIAKRHLAQRFLNFLKI